MPVRFHHTQGIFGWLLGNSRKLKQLILDYNFVTINMLIGLIHCFLQYSSSHCKTNYWGNIFLVAEKGD
jgi:hypothetical protein